MAHRTTSLVLAAALLGGCSGPGGPAPETATSSRPLVGVPVDGYPNYQERLALQAINRTRAAPNDVAHGTAAECSATRPATRPLMHAHDGARAARFHSTNLLVNQGGLSHDSYCTLRDDVATSGCDGAASCACVEGTECWSCQTLGGCGTPFYVRAGLFGFGANGEVGAAGYGDGARAVEAWVTECPPADGHRQILTSESADVIGVGFAAGSGCWGSYIYGNTGYHGVETAVLPSGVHTPELGAGAIELRTSYFSAGPARAVYAVVDGECHAMSIELGAPTNATYLATVDVGAGCHAYWFLAHDEAGVAHAYPEAGSWGLGDCTEWRPTRIETGCDGAPPPVVDAGTPAPDAATTRDAEVGDAEGPRDAERPIGADASGVEPAAD
ncbi:hypothetical protein L6R52_15635, partial [Myxococcota bacterium]|nr:hypothetical protein [Myxococcota bacterium]